MATPSHPPSRSKSASSRSQFKRTLPGYLSARVIIIYAEVNKLLSAFLLTTQGVRVQSELLVCLHPNKRETISTYIFWIINKLTCTWMCYILHFPVMMFPPCLTLLGTCLTVLEKQKYPLVYQYAMWISRAIAGLTSWGGLPWANTICKKVYEKEKQRSFQWWCWWAMRRVYELENDERDRRQDLLYPFVQTLRSSKELLARDCYSWNSCVVQPIGKHGI